MDILKEVSGAHTIGISGHIRPDGDCVGSCLAMYLYLKKQCKDAKISVFLEQPPTSYNILAGYDELITDFATETEQFDVFIALDCAADRLGDARAFFENAKKKINIDHHISNFGAGDVNYIVPQASSASELAYDVMDDTLLTEDIAKALYVGMINDCGIFQYSNTSPKTMRIAARLMEFGFDFPAIIHRTFHEKVYAQNLLLGRALLNSELALSGSVIYTCISREMMEEYQALPKHLDGIVNELGNTRGVEVAIMLYQTENDDYKVSMRSQGAVDVAKIAMSFGGGGHVRAAGVTMSGESAAIVAKLIAEIEKQLKGENQ